MSSVRQLFPSLAAFTLLSACGVEDRNIRVGSALEDSIAQFAVTTCNREMECSPTSIHRSYGSTEECEHRTILQNKWLTSLPGVAWDAAAYDKCTQSWKTASCDDINLGTTLPDCDSPGARLTGEDCNSSAQCASSFCSNIGYNCGKCADKLSEGDTCDTSLGCGGDLLCESDGVCRKPAKLNEPCSDTQSCDTGFQCYSGSCTHYVGSGQQCDVANGLYCDFGVKGLLCGSTSMTCISVSPKGAGESCATQSYCEKEGICGSDQTCSAGPGDSDFCDSSQSLYCEWPAICLNQKCQLPTQFERCGN
jgi:hypothetical protein